MAGISSSVLKDVEENGRRTVPIDCDDDNRKGGRLCDLHDIVSLLLSASCDVVRMVIE